MLFYATACECDVGGSQDQTCDKTSGQCNCKPRINGLRCDRYDILIALLLSVPLLLHSIAQIGCVHNQKSD